MKDILQDLDMPALEGLCRDFGEPSYRAGQIYTALMQGTRISDMTVLPSSFREKLLERFEDEPVRIIKTLTAKDGTEKYLFALADGNVIEGVFMSYKYGNTQCVSTQAGCRMGCTFCASTLGGLIRNLSSGEIMGQVAAVNARRGGTLKKRAVTNIVLMGSGEPLDNYGEVIKFIRGVSSEKGLGISPRNISLSTCGIVPKMYALADEGLPVCLTVSLHAADDGTRRKTMPIANRYKISEILDACSYYFKKTGRRYIFEYALVHGENCDAASADRLIKLLKGRPCHVNLIRLNEVKERKLKRADEKETDAFLKRLEAGGLSVTLRRSMGADIGGACGQLRASYLKSQEE